MYTILAAQSSPLSYLKLPALMSPDLGLLRNVHPRISSPEVRQKHRKEFTPLRYRELGEYHGCRHHISTRLVRGICKLQPVKSPPKGSLLTGYQREQTCQRLKDVEGSVRLPPKNTIRAVRGDECQPLAIQVHVLCPRLLHGPLAWICLPIERGNPPKASEMVDLWHSANGEPCRKGLARDLHHREEALGWKLAQTGEEMSLGL